MVVGAGVEYGCGRRNGRRGKPYTSWTVLIKVASGYTCRQDDAVRCAPGLISACTGLPLQTSCQLESSFSFTTICCCFVAAQMQLSCLRLLIYLHSTQSSFEVAVCARSATIMLRPCAHHRSSHVPQTAILGTIRETRSRKESQKGTTHSYKHSNSNTLLSTCIQMKWWKTAVVGNLTVLCV